MKKEHPWLPITILLGLGLLLISAVWFFFLRPSGQPPTPVPVAPLAITDPTLTRYQINPAASEARFVIDEELRGAAKTVIGVTNQLSGQIAANLDDPARAQIGLIRINPRTFNTDNEFRTAAVRDHILAMPSDAYITFAPTAIHPLPTSVTPPLTFTVSGSLTIGTISRPETFTVTLTAVSPTTLQGSATATINRNDYQLTIPQAPGVANVSETVNLSLDFIAEPAPNEIP